MGEKDTDIQSSGIESVKIKSKWARISLWCVGIGYLSPFIWWILERFLPVDFEMKSPLTKIAVLGFLIILLISSILIIIGLITGIVALIHIKLSKNEIKGIGKAVISIILSSLYIALVCAILIPALSRVRMSVQRDVCLIHLSELGKSLRNYADKYETYPTSDKWCDILLKSKDANEAILKCPGNKKVKCGYAINPNCEPNSAADVVLLFDSKGGWNSFGGVELLTIDNHDGEGTFILYNGGYVRFNIADPNGKIIEELNWGEKGKGRGLK